MAGAESDIITIVAASLVIVGTGVGAFFVLRNAPTAEQERQYDRAEKRRERAQRLRRVQENRRRERLEQHTRRRWKKS